MSNKTSKLLSNPLPIIPAKDKILVSPIDENIGAMIGGLGSRPASVVSGAIDKYGNITLDAGANINFVSVTAPTACVATLVTTGTGNIDNGTHKYYVTYINATGETELGSVSNTVTVDATHKQVVLSSIPVSTSNSVTSRKIYRTRAGETYVYLLTTINDNTTTTYTDNIADSGLGSVDVTNQANDSAGMINLNTIPYMKLSPKNTNVGYYSSYTNTTGYADTAIGVSALFSNTTGYANTAIGESVLLSNTTGYGNTTIGLSALESNTIGYLNTVIGVNAFYFNIEGNSNIGLGYCAGFYETGSNAFYVNNQDRTNTAGDKANSLLYGVMAAAAANQKLTINALLNQSVSKTPSAANDTGTAGDICWDTSYIYVCTATDTWKRVAISTW